MNELMVLWVYGRLGTAFEFFSGMVFVHKGAIVVAQLGNKNKN